MRIAAWLAGMYFSGEDEGLWAEQRGSVAIVIRTVNTIVERIAIMVNLKSRVLKSRLRRDLYQA